MIVPASVNCMAWPLDRPQTKPTMIGMTRKNPPALGVGLLIAAAWQSRPARASLVMVD